MTIKTSKDLGIKIKGLREKKNWTLEELSIKSGVSKSFLSRIEKNQSSPSIETIFKLADAMGLKAGDLFESGLEDSDILLVRPKRWKDGVGYKFRNHSKEDSTRRLQNIFYEVRFPYQKVAPNLRFHEGYELVWLSHGEIEIQIQDTLTKEIKIRTLKEGESVFFPSRYPHAYFNKNKEEAKGVVLVTETNNSGDDLGDLNFL